MFGENLTLQKKNHKSGLTARKFTVVGLSFMVVFMGAFLLTQSSGQTEGAPATSGGLFVDDQATHMRWSSRIAHVGPLQAYQEFKKTFGGEAFNVQHLAVHMMGEVLYRALGLEGLLYCDSSFAFGCYHSFFGLALAEHGEQVILQLDEVCVKKFGPFGTGCQHGIGHGTLIFSGMSEDGLIRALKLCKKTTQVNELFGCTSGVFMEYNMPTLFGVESAERDLRTLNLEKPYAPCDSVVPYQLRNSCYYELPLWWQRILKDQYTKLGRLCGKVKNKEYQVNCFLGLGGAAALDKRYDVERTIFACRKMPSKEFELVCRAGASWSFFAEEEHRRKSSELCRSLDPERHKKCIKQSDLIKNGKTI